MVSYGYKVPNSSKVFCSSLTILQTKIHARNLESPNNLNEGENQTKLIYLLPMIPQIRAWELNFLPNWNWKLYLSRKPKLSITYEPSYWWLPCKIQMHILWIWNWRGFSINFPYSQKKKKLSKNFFSGIFGVFAIRFAVLIFGKDMAYEVSAFAIGQYPDYNASFFLS